MIQYILYKVCCSLHSTSDVILYVICIYIYYIVCYIIQYIIYYAILYNIYDILPVYIAYTILNNMLNNSLHNTKHSCVPKMDGIYHM